MTKAYFSFVAIFIGVSLQLICLFSIQSGKNNNPYYPAALGSILVITIILLFVVWVTKPDTVKSLLKSNYRLNVYELMLAAWMSTCINIKKRNTTKEMVIEQIKEDKIYLSEKFNTIRKNFSEENHINPELLQFVHEESVIKKAIIIHLEKPKGRFVTYYEPGDSEYDAMQVLPFYTCDSHSGPYYDALSSVVVSKKYLDERVEQKELIHLPMPVYISDSETVAMNPDGKIFIVKDYLVGRDYY